MDAAMLESITKGSREDVTGKTASYISPLLTWYKLYGAGVILYDRPSRDTANGTYRATVNGTDYVSFQQSGTAQPNPAELAARQWIDANAPSSATIPVISTTNTNTTTGSSSSLSAGMIVGIVAIIILLVVVLYPRRKTFFDRRR